MLIDSHEHLMAFHAELFEAAGVDPATIKPPLHAVIGNWAEGASLSFVRPRDRQVPVVQSPARGGPEADPGHNIYVANQDWGYKSGWAIGSLKMAEKVLEAEFGLAQPEWLDDSTSCNWYQKNILTLISRDRQRGGREPSIHYPQL